LACKTFDSDETKRFWTLVNSNAFTTPNSYRFWVFATEALTAVTDFSAASKRFFAACASSNAH